MDDIEWTCKYFNALTPYELYDIMQLRNEVFVVEQNCVFQDADNKDRKCYHLMGRVKDKLVAYARLVPAGISYKHVSIGRVVTSVGYRNKGAGKALMNTALDQCKFLFDKQDIEIGAQLYLKKFYESLGFKQIGDVYDEDGIPHIMMIRMN